MIDGETGALRIFREPKRITIYRKRRPRKRTQRAGLTVDRIPRDVFCAKVGGECVAVATIDDHGRWAHGGSEWRATYLY